MPLFSIIAVHYQGAIPHEIFCRGIRSIDAQTFRDFELICVHDGPLLEPDLDMPCDVYGTPTRADDWGHTPHDYGLNAARGEYIIHFNVDNVLYPDALEEIAREIRRPPRPWLDEEQRKLDANDIVVFPIRAYGLQRVFGRYTAQMPDDGFYEILSGNPPQALNIDTLQLVMRRSLWLLEGGWRDKTRNSDAILYPEFCRKYGYRIVGPVIGERH